MREATLSACGARKLVSYGPLGEVGEKVRVGALASLDVTTLGLLWVKVPFSRGGPSVMGDSESSGHIRATRLGLTWLIWVCLQRLRVLGRIGTTRLGLTWLIWVCLQRLRVLGRIGTTRLGLSGLIWVYL
jgi:hypothetical protein